MKLLQLALLVLLILLLRKLFWCLLWLWRYYHGQETPDPISFLPRRSGSCRQGCRGSTGADYTYWTTATSYSRQ